MWCALLLGLSSTLSPTDRVAVVGGSGNVGRLVALRLAKAGYPVTALARNPSDELRAFLPATVTVAPIDLATDSVAAVSANLADARVLIVCTGTTAFPTKAWDRRRDGASVTLPGLQALARTRSIEGAIAELDSEGFNTPNNVDKLGMEKLLAAWRESGAQRKRLVLVSSIGVQRRGEMPFPVLNACGVLDAKAAAEERLKADAAAAGYSWTIVRPGQLFGGPYDNNYYLGTLFQLDKDADTRGVSVTAGDTAMGDTLRSTLAEVVCCSLIEGFGIDSDFACVNVPGEAPSEDELQRCLASLSGAN